MMIFVLAASLAQDASLGVFTHAGDVGQPAMAGSTVFDSSTGEYKITGAGENMWAKKDQFQFVWREVTGNFALTATMRFLGQGAAHRKAGIVVRQSLDANSAYADAILHGDGMPAVQWRSRTGEDTNAFDFPSQTPGTYQVKMVRTGVKIFMYLAKEGGELKELAHTEVTLGNPVLVGLGVCSHLATESTAVVFSKVSIDALPPPPPAKPQSAQPKA